jgi:hypothetical protein
MVLILAIEVFKEVKSWSLEASMFENAIAVSSSGFVVAPFHSLLLVLAPWPFAIVLGLSSGKAFL